LAFNTLNLQYSKGEKMIDELTKDILIIIIVIFVWWIGVSIVMED